MFSGLFFFFQFPNFLLQRFYGFHQLADFAQLRLLPQPFHVGHLRKACQDLIVPHITDHTAASRYCIIITDRNVTHGRRLAAKGIIIADRYAAGNPHHRYEQVIFPDHIVMSQMHQIIQFCPVAHDGAANRRSVDTGIAADFHRTRHRRRRSRTAGYSGCRRCSFPAR